MPSTPHPVSIGSTSGLIDYSEKPTRCSRRQMLLQRNEGSFAPHRPAGKRMSLRKGSAFIGTFS